MFLFEQPATNDASVPSDDEIQAPIATTSPALPSLARQTILAVLLAGIALQAAYFQRVFRREGPDRGYVFDSAYKDVYDAATALPDRPIYLSDGTQPAYEHAYWYAVVEGRNHAEFIHLKEGQRAPSGTLVIGSEAACTRCQVIKQSGDYILYRSF